MFRRRNDDTVILTDGRSVGLEGTTSCQDLPRRKAVFRPNGFRRKDVSPSADWAQEEDQNKPMINP
jgi:hypothetical protein